MKPQQAFLSSIKKLIPAVYDRFPLPNTSTIKKENWQEDDPRYPHVQLFGLLKSLQFLTAQSES